MTFLRGSQVSQAKSHLKKLTNKALSFLRQNNQQITLTTIITLRLSSVFSFMFSVRKRENYFVHSLFGQLSVTDLVPWLEKLERSGFGRSFVRSITVVQAVSPLQSTSNPLQSTSIHHTLKDLRKTEFFSSELFTL